MVHNVPCVFPQSGTTHNTRFLLALHTHHSPSALSTKAPCLFSCCQGTLTEHIQSMFGLFGPRVPMCRGHETGLQRTISVKTWRWSEGGDYISNGCAATCTHMHPPYSPPHTLTHTRTHALAVQWLTHTAPQLQTHFLQSLNCPLSLHWNQKVVTTNRIFALCSEIHR